MVSLHRSEKNILETFLSDPRTMNLRDGRETSVHIAVLVKRGKVIAQAANKIGSRSRGCGYSDYTIHAERNVVKMLGDISQIKGADMYVMRITKDRKKSGFDQFMGSKPCSSCQCFLEKCIREYGLKNVYFTS
jgi:hypothetical protein